ncbi:YoaK family protein [Marinomonas sp. 15G1-11]|uniref:YoaK family protein n=1 Tax=Marinomonas phaeophyticola TaxID=3004091 RepID=A0ABT4JVN8_9GAMM|nr:YoaK family protein [Marinomonas sp. 15G1-11]MCZ2722310.1 YoaK family protein [Marinomonas sp. 15G1-11]
MISKLPRWVEYGSFLLALVAGLVNSIGLLGFKHQSISHLSGTATLLGTGIINSTLTDTLHLAAILMSFLVGASVSGYFLRSGSLKLGHNYSGLLSLEAVFLLIALYFLSTDSFSGHYFASAACGLQNALATTFSGAVVRTTHVTGIFTDLGIMLGSKLRGVPFDNRKALLFMLIITGFICGGAFGAYFFSLFQFQALFIPAAICFLLAFSYSMYIARYANKTNKVEV